MCLRVPQRHFRAITRARFFPCPVCGTASAKSEEGGEESARERGVYMEIGYKKFLESEPKMKKRGLLKPISGVQVLKEWSVFTKIVTPRLRSLGPNVPVTAHGLLR